jgi:hypothetical protein
MSIRGALWYKYANQLLIAFLCTRSETCKMPMSVQVYDNKRTKSDVWVDFGLKRMKLYGGIEQEMVITQYPICIK